MCCDRKKAIKIGTFLLILILFFILRAFSLFIALFLSGYDLGAITYLQHRGIDYQDKEFCVILTETRQDDELALIRAEKNWIGFWEIINVASTSEQDGQFHTELHWVNTESSGGIYDSLSAPPLQEETHYAYCGKDALGRIQILKDQLPDNMTALVQQTGNEYLVHVITFAYTELYEDYLDFDMFKILRDNGFIP